MFLDMADGAPAPGGADGSYRLGAMEASRSEFWHVRVQVKDPRGKVSRANEVVVVDRDRAWVDARVLEPRRRNQPITLSGRELKWPEIESVWISVSEVPSSVLIQQIKARDASSSALVIGGPSYQWRAAGRATNMTDELIDSPVGSMTEEASTNPGQAADPRKVMVVHGRDDEARLAMFTFLRALGLEPQEWGALVEATGSAAPYIGEVLDKAFGVARAVVVLFTPDDEASLRPGLRGPSEPDHETKPTPQARPNVLFEAGMALGIHPERTVLVELGQLRPFSDIYGRHVVRLNGTEKPLKDIARRLSVAGCAVDDKGDDWRVTKFPER
jgi:predicted nucleotide-binding protein